MCSLERHSMQHVILWKKQKIQGTALYCKYSVLNTSMLCTTWYGRLAKLHVDTGNKLELKTADIL